MDISKAINKRIAELLKQNNISAYQLSYRGGMSSSVISDCKRGKVKAPSLSSIIHICEGFDIKLKDFFDSPLFDEVEAIERSDKSK